MTQYDKMRQAWTTEKTARALVGSLRDCTTIEELDKRVLVALRAVIDLYDAQAIIIKKGGGKA